MKQPELSPYMMARKPSGIRLGQIKFLERKNPPILVNGSIGNVMRPMHPAMQRRLFDLGGVNSPFHESQVAHYKPIYTQNINEADEYCTDRVLHGYCGAWFSGITGTKVDSLDCDLIDGLSKLHPNWQIVVEADGAKEKWLKAPKTSEPVIPTLTKTTIGLVNLQMLGAPLDDEHVHNIELVQDIVKRDMGAIVTPRMLADLVLHKQGLFQYSKGKKILFCTGYETVQHRIIDDFIDHIVDSDISAIILADGYKASCEIRRIIQCR